MVFLPSSYNKKASPSTSSRHLQLSNIYLGTAVHALLHTDKGKDQNVENNVRNHLSEIYYDIVPTDSI